MIERQLPFSEEAERGVLGSLLRDWERCSELCDEKSVTADHFYVRQNQIVFESMMHLRQTKPVDMLTLGEELRGQDRLGRIGGYDYLEVLVDSTPTSAHFEYYAEILNEKSKRREIIESNRAITDMCYDDSVGVDKIVAVAQDAAFKADDEAACIVDKQEATEAIMERVLSAAEGKVSGNPFPWPEMNERTGGLRRQCVTPMLGRDGQGKSTLLTYMLEYWGSVGLPTLVFPFEDGAERYMMRMAGKDTWSNFEVENCSFANTTQEVLDEKIDLIQRTVERVRDMPIYFADGMMDVSQIVSVIRKMHRKHGVKQVVIDNAKDVITDCSDGLTEGQGRTTRMLAAIAKECDLNILISSHVHDVQDSVWLTRRNIKGSKEQKDGARQVLIFQNAFDNDNHIAKAVCQKYIVTDKSRYLLMDKNNFGADGVGVCLDQNFSMQSWVNTPLNH